MKAFLDEYLKIITYTLVGLLLVISSYSIILNIRHAKVLSQHAYVSDIDVDYKKYKEDIIEIENNLQEKEDNDLVKALNDTIKNMKDDGIFRLLPNKSLSFADLYSLNEYFIETLINNCWITEIKMNVDNHMYDSKIDMVVNNSKYIRHNLVNNGLSMADYIIDDKANDDYHFILKNYALFSDIILDISENIGGNDAGLD